MTDEQHWRIRPRDGRWEAVTPRGNSIMFDDLGIALDYAHSRVRMSRRLKEAHEWAERLVESARPGNADRQFLGNWPASA